MGLSLPRSRRVEPYSPTYKDWRIPDTPGPLSPPGSAASYAFAEEAWEKQQRQRWWVKVIATVMLVFAVAALSVWMRLTPLTTSEAANATPHRSWSSVESPWAAGDKVWWNPGFSKPKMPNMLWNNDFKVWWRSTPATKTASSVTIVDQVVSTPTAVDGPGKLMPMFGHGAALLAREMPGKQPSTAASIMSIPDFPLSQRRLNEVGDGDFTFLDRSQKGALAWHAMLPTNNGLMRNGADFTELSFFHQLRCLIQVRDVLADTTRQVSDQVWTCLEYLRLSMLCSSGEPVLESIAAGGMTSGRRCRNSAAVKTWVEEKQK